MTLEYPTGPVPLTSPFYIERPAMERQIAQEIGKPGALIRMRAPKNTGKTSLLLRTLEEAKRQGYRTVSLNLEQVDRAILDDLARFLRWLCTSVSRQLALPPQLDEYWDEDIGSKISCTLYFQYYLLPQLDAPLLLSLDETNQLLEHPQVAGEVFPLLRSWYEEAKTLPVWQKLRLLVVHSTDIYIPLKLTQSPFNIGLPIKLPEFTLPQVQELAERHGLDWTAGSEASQLMAMVGGHPYLLRLALYHLSQGTVTFPQLLAEAPTPQGIYREHLQRHLTLIQQEPSLAAALQDILLSEGNISLPPNLAYQLENMGLLRLNGEQGLPLWELYRAYFASQLLEPDSSLHSRLQQLEQENQKLKDLVNFDELTQIFNRRYFNRSLASEWRRLARESAPLSLILLDVDHFKNYNEAYGHPQGDVCLRQVAQAMQKCLKRPADLAARYGGEEFAVILPRTDGEGARHLAETIRQAIKDLAIDHADTSVPGGIVTVSLGVATLVPSLERKPDILVQAADQALFESKHQGRDRTTAIGV